MSEQLRPRDITDPVNITVNGDPVTVQKGELLIDACERNGAYIPRFCYHPRLEPVGMCRMCLVEVDTGRGPALQPSCMIPCAPDMVVDTASEAVSKAQDGVLEFLLANHPLDCPVCDKGGECPLQDQTMAYGPGESRWVEQKRHYAKPIPISETVYLDRERCILCDRCTRFADDVAGEPLIHFIDRGASTQVNTFPGEPFASYFSGNTVQICPVGALTAKPYRFTARPWDLEEVESTCTTCSVGCQVMVQSTRNQVVRIQGVDSDPVNWSWLCDKGRFGFEALNHGDRLREPSMPGPIEAGAATAEASPNRVAVTWSAALAAVATAIAAAPPERVAVIGGSRLTNEAAYAWTRLAKGVIGTDHVDAQLADGLPAELALGLPGATIDEICAPGATVVYLGPDPREELPVLFLRLRHAVERDRVTLIEIAPTRTSISGFASRTVLHPVGEAPAAMAEVLDSLTAGGATSGPVYVVVGRPSVAEHPSLVADSVALVRERLPEARFLVGLRRGNVRGALEMGMAPGLLPGRVTLDAGRDRFSSSWPTVPQGSGEDTVGILEAAAAGSIDVLILVGADPLSDLPDAALAARGLAGAGTVVAVDTFLNPSSAAAALVLPAAAYGEVVGTTTNLEGRVTALGRAVSPTGTSRADWAIALELARLLGDATGPTSLEALVVEMTGLCHVDVGPEPESAEPESAEPESAESDTSRSDTAEPGEGVEPDPTADESHDAEAGAGSEDVTGADGGGATPVASVSWEPPVAPTVVEKTSSYSLRLTAGRRLYDHGTAVAHCPSSVSLVGPSTVSVNPADLRPLGVESGDPLVLVTPTGSATVVADADPGVPQGTARLNGGSPGVVGQLVSVSGAPVTQVRLESVTTTKGAR